MTSRCYIHLRWRFIEYFNIMIRTLNLLFFQSIAFQNVVLCLFSHMSGWIFFSILLTVVLVGFQGAKLGGRKEEDVEMGVVHKSLKHLFLAQGSCVRVDGCSQAREAVEVSQLQLPALIFPSSSSFLFLLHIFLLWLLCFLRHSSWRLCEGLLWTEQTKI